MKLKALKKFETKDYELSRIVSWLREFFEQIMPNLFLRGELLTITVTTSGLSVDHKLGQTPSGWMIQDIDANATVWRTAWDEKTISFDASTTVNLKVWVF